MSSPVDRDRHELRQRIAAYEAEIRGDQLLNVPSQIGVVDPVPKEPGGYTDDDLDLIKTFEVEIRETMIVAGRRPDPDETLAKALYRFNLRPRSN